MHLALLLHFTAAEPLIASGARLSESLGSILQLGQHASGEAHLQGSFSNVSPRRALKAASCSPHQTILRSAPESRDGAFASLLAFNVANDSPLPISLEALEIALAGSAGPLPGRPKAVSVFLLSGRATARAVQARSADWVQVFSDADWPQSAPARLVLSLTGLPLALRTVPPGGGLGVAVSAANASGFGAVQTSLAPVAVPTSAASPLGEAWVSDGTASVSTAMGVLLSGAAAPASENNTSSSGALLLPGAAQGFAMQPLVFAGGVIYRTLCPVRPRPSAQRAAGTLPPD